MMPLKRTGRYYETVSGSFHVRCKGVFEGSAGQYMNDLASSGKTLEEAKANLEDLGKRECVDGFSIDKWEEQVYCPLVYNHHIGSTCKCCGQKD